MARKYSKKPSHRRRHSQSGGSTDTQAVQAAPGVPQITPQALQEAGKIAQGILNNMATQNKNPQVGGGSTLQGTDIAATDAGLKGAMAGGAVAGAVAAAEGYSSLKGSPLVGGRRKRGSKRGGQSQSQSQSHSQSQSQSQSQKGGMVPGLLSAVETALVPLGLYLGQKALQSRKSGSRSLGKSFNFRRDSRRTRRRR
jgi:hypothetical protein